MAQPIKAEPLASYIENRLRFGSGKHADAGVGDLENRQPHSPRLKIAASGFFAGIALFPQFKALRAVLRGPDFS